MTKLEFIVDTDDVDLINEMETAILDLCTDNSIVFVSHQTDVKIKSIKTNIGPGD